MTVPTTEQLVDLEKDIQRLIERKRRIDQHIVDLEARIYAVETDYLRETAQFGCILNGLEGYLGTTSTTSGGSTSQTPTSVRRVVSREIRDSDRLFSNTSTSYQRVFSLPMNSC